MSQSAVRVATGLQQHLTKECLQKAAECFRIKPRHLLFYHPIKFEIRHTFPSSKLSLYSEEINGTTYWLGHLRNKLSKDTPIFTYEGTYNEADFLKAFEEFENIHDLFARSRLPLIVAEEKITTSTEKLAQYRCTPNLEEEARCMTGTWRYGADGGLELTREKIRRFPSVCVRKDGRMVGFYMLEPLGWLNHHFVFEEHRGKGIGTLLELAHSQNCIRAGMRVCKLVELCNQTAIESTKRSKYWTLAKGDSGEELVIDYLDIYK
ncbi:hypothetical protein NECAME_07707 [Necator americanus]|uniref:Glycine N-acyltransferase-like protein n=1 Tax=Necator americanus TaxID=51031 RepID=W2TMJ4_NECAM|nr:hypothetical protein NECAME_07707 [Necator americanus]ETN82874.1 hypothetical protein NECAME_07707 [Necator americanus]